MSWFCTRPPTRSRASTTTTETPRARQIARRRETREPGADHRPRRPRVSASRPPARDPTPARRCPSRMASPRAALAPRSARRSAALNMRTLVIASVASASAAAVTSQLWIAGTWIAAALTPVLGGAAQRAAAPADRADRARDGRATGRRSAPAPHVRPSPWRRPRRSAARPGDAAAAPAGPVRVYRQPSGRAPRRDIALGVVGGHGGDRIRRRGDHPDRGLISCRVGRSERAAAARRSSASGEEVPAAEGGRSRSRTPAPGQDYSRIRPTPPPPTTLPRTGHARRRARTSNRTRHPSRRRSTRRRPRPARRPWPSARTSECDPYRRWSIDHHGHRPNGRHAAPDQSRWS